MLDFLRILFDKMSGLFKSNSGSGNSNNFSMFNKTVVSNVTVTENKETQLVKDKRPKMIKTKDAVPAPFQPSSFPKRFVAYYNATLQLEGNVQYEYDPHDPGGATAWGISVNANPDLADEISLGMSKDRAYAIAYERYYSVIPFVMNVNPQIGFVIFDSRFHGMRENVKIIQSYLNERFGLSLAVDGVAGAKTMYAVSQMQELDVKIILRKLTDNAKMIAGLAAKRTIQSQISKRLAVKDYAVGFTNRQLGRLNFAYTMEV